MRPIDAHEFEELYRATARDVLAYVRRRTPVDADDLVAEVYAVAWRRRDDLPAPALRRAWLFGVARTLLLAEGRRRRSEHEATRHTSTAPPAEEVEPAADGPEPARGPVAEALARLSPAEREVLRLTTWEGLTPTELAVALGITPGSARVRLHRARRAFAADPDVRALVENRSRVHPAAGCEKEGSPV